LSPCPLISRKIIDDLIAFDTTSRDSNLELISYVQNYLDGQGVTSDLIYNDDATKANLYATIGPDVAGGIILSGHTDVVPVDGQNWSDDPFKVREKDGRLIGRGTSDMKSFLGVVLASVPMFKQHELETPLHIAFSYDEEVGCLGVRGLIKALNEKGQKPAYCLVGEPTGMEVVISHKGKRAYQVIVTGKPAHTSRAPEGVNAIENAARLIAFIADMNTKFAHDGPFDDMFNITHTTCLTSIIQGGVAQNIVPETCRFSFEFRFLPDQNPEDHLAIIQDFATNTLEAEMRKCAPDASIEIIEILAYPGLNTAPDADIVSFGKGLSQRNTHGKVDFGTEGGLFQRDGGIDTIVCGPGYIAQAHTPDEFIAIEQIANCEAFMQRLAENVRKK
jgi:acetylornithine deacetylase